MSEISPERTYYVRASLMYTDMTREVILKVFRFLTKTEDIAAFLSLPDQRNELWELRNNNILNKADYNLVSGHVLNVDRFDISLLIRLILSLCKDEISQPQFGWNSKPQPHDESLGADLLRLRDVRNKIIGHRADAKLSEAQYEHTWQKIKAILLRVVQNVDQDYIEGFERRLDEYKQLDIDNEDSRIKKLMTELLDYKKEIDSLQERVKDLTARSNELQVYFKTTPEQFVRYIKLLFEGGQFVLCGILERELGDKDLSDLLAGRRDTLVDNIEEIFFNCLFPEEPNIIDHRKWDICLLASVLLLLFSDSINRVEIKYLERIKEARLNYADCALRSLNTDESLKIWINLINCLNHLSINISEEYGQKVEHLIEFYQEKDDMGCNAEEYFEQLRESGIEVKTLNDVYNETITRLMNMLRQLSEKGIIFKQEYVLEMKMLITCENEEMKRKAEDLLESHLKASLRGSAHQFEPIRIETDKLVASVAAHPDVKPGEVIRKCIMWTFKCSTPYDLLHILDYFTSDQFSCTLVDIASELHYMNGYVFSLQGHLTFESLSRLRLLTDSAEEAPSEQIVIPLKCSSVDGIKSVLSGLKQERTTNSLNKIAEQISAEVRETVSIKVFPDMMEFRDVFNETDSEGSSSFGNNEEATEELVSCEMDEIPQTSYTNNEEDHENSEKRVDFESSNKCAREDADDKKHIDFVCGYAEDKTTNDIHTGQHVEDEEGNVSTYNYGATVMEVETITSSLKSIDIREEPTTKVLPGQNEIEYNLGDIVKGQERESCVRDVSERNKKTDCSGDIIYETMTKKISDRKDKRNAEKYDFYTVCRYLKEGLKGVVKSFSQRDFLTLCSKVLENPNTVECNGCLLESLLPAHTSVSNRCPLGQENCNCLYAIYKKPCPGNVCSVIHDEIIKRHRYSSVHWCRKYCFTNWDQNDWEITKFFIDDYPFFKEYTCIEDLKCFDLLDIMINNVEFQNEVSFQIDPPFDVLSKVRIYLLVAENDHTDINLDDMVNDVIPILTDKKTICNIPSAQKAVLDLQELRNRERKYRTSEMESITSIYIRRGCQRESDKYKEFTEFLDQRKIGREKKSDSSDKNDDDTMIQASLHGNYSLCTQEDAMEKKPKPDSPPLSGTLSAKPHSYEEISVENDYDQLLIETETTIKMIMDSTKKISERELLDLQDKVEYLIKTRESLGSVLFQSTKLDLVRERFLQMKQTYLSKDDYYWEYKWRKKSFNWFLKKKIEHTLGLFRLSKINLYSHERKRIRNEKDVFYENGELCENIIVSGTSSECREFCTFLIKKWTSARKRYISSYRIPVSEKILSDDSSDNWSDDSLDDFDKLYNLFDDTLDDLYIPRRFRSTDKSLPYQNTLPNIQYVFILSLESVKETHIHDIIKSKLLARSQYLPLFEQILFRESEKCLFILNGLHQWKPDTEVSKSSIIQGFYQMPQRNPMCDYVVIFTTEEKDLKDIKLTEKDKLIYIESECDFSRMHHMEDISVDKTPQRYSYLDSVISEKGTYENLPAINSLPSKYQYPRTSEKFPSKFQEEEPHVKTELVSSVLGKAYEKIPRRYQKTKTSMKFPSISQDESLE